MAPLHQPVARVHWFFAVRVAVWESCKRTHVYILKELWTKDVEVPEVKNSFQYVFELREKLEDTLNIAHSELQKAQQKGKHYYDRKTKVRKFQE